MTAASDHDPQWGQLPRANEGARGRGRREFVCLASLLLLACTLQLGFLVGVTGSDNLNYATACAEIAKGTFHLAEPNLYCTRSLFVYPPAALFRWLGVSELTAAAYPMACSLGLLTLTYLVGRRFCGPRVGLLAAALLGLCPIYVIISTTLLPDVPLAFYMTLSVYLFLAGDSSSSRWRRLLFVGAGIAMGAGWLVKETAVVLVVFYAAFFLLNRRRISLAHVLVLVAAAAVFLIETALYGWVTGNPLFRLHAFMAPAEVAKSAAYAGSRWDYVRKMFISINEFGFLFYLLLGALVYALARRRKDLATPALWFFAIYLYMNFGTFSLRSWEFIWTNSRYLIPALVPACLLAAFWLHNSVRRRAVWVYYAILAFVAASSFGFTCFDYGKTVAWREGAKWAWQWLEKRDAKVVYADSSLAGQLWFYSAGSPLRRTTILPYSNDAAKVARGYVVVAAAARGRSDKPSAPPLPETQSVPRHWQVAATQTVTPGGAAGMSLKLVNRILRTLPRRLATTLTPRGDDWKGMAEGNLVTIYYVPRDGEGP